MVDEGLQDATHFLVKWSRKVKTFAIKDSDFVLTWYLQENYKIYILLLIIIICELFT